MPEDGNDRKQIEISDLEVGDRVDLSLHGATMTNHATATVLDTDPITTIKHGVVVDLDENYRHCDNPYTVHVSMINRIIGDANE